MLKKTPVWKLTLAALGLLIVIATLLYVNSFTTKLKREEKLRMKAWVEANMEILTSSSNTNLNMATEIVAGNTTIPVIQVDRKGHILSVNNLGLEGEHIVEENKKFLTKKLDKFKSLHNPIILRYNPKDSTQYYKVYYGESSMLRRIRYFPYIQLTVIALFIVVTLIALNSSNRAKRNQLWAGLAKETAHQLGTPLSSMEAWVELLKENKDNESIVKELNHDLSRLKMISERFSKIGSMPELEEAELISHVHNVVVYMKHRAPKLIRFKVTTDGEKEIPAMISPLLFDWVLENLLKNALDAMDGKGSITIDISTHAAHSYIDITDTGKGIPTRQFENVFSPGYSTKKRGWGLGLSLSRRIMESYHKGKLFIEESEVGKGTTFRIMLRK
ncbi:MAG TPA: HAMP domain-containing sensor histidine kinase [Chitinophagaceae bacterium]|nr:HAMP domain-containing sensor histidine kinase [Chitinophagaceae bacterium]